MTKVLTILGSPRKESNGLFLIKEILNGIKSLRGDCEIDEIFVSQAKIGACIACEGCYHTPGCVIIDDMIKIYPKFDRADIVLVASPIYFNSISAQLKALIDRCQAIWASKYILNEPIIDRYKYRLGVFIATAGSKQEFAEFEPAKRIMELFFKAINTQYYQNLLVANTDDSPVTIRPKLLKEAYNLGVQLIKCINSHSKDI